MELHPKRCSPQSRRSFVRKVGAFATMAGLGLSGSRTTAGQGGSSKQAILFEGFPMPPKRGVYEAILAQLTPDRYCLFFGEKRQLVAKVSSDYGRTWSATTALRAEDGSPITLARDTCHLSLFHLRSGALGIIHGGPASRPGRDGTLLYRSSHDRGKTWSAPVMIDPLFSVCDPAHGVVLSTGRIIVPVFAWLSAFAGGESESEENGLTFSWVFYSDDEGKTWKRSLSELVVSIDQGRSGSYAFEEPSIEELKDGRLLMFGRTELGRFYRSVSKDGGASWSVPEPVALACAYCAPLLIRIPATGDLLLVWNQASGEEILAGLSRHRLSTAISRDDGTTWTHFNNLESLDDRTRLASPPAEPHVYRMVDYEYRQPVDRVRYRFAPGCLRICYPSVVFHEKEVAIAYDYGHGVGELAERNSTTKIKVVSLDWLYGRG
jgi:BNR repeat protein